MLASTAYQSSGSKRKALAERRGTVVFMLGLTTEDGASRGQWWWHGCGEGRQFKTARWENRGLNWEACNRIGQKAWGRTKRRALRRTRQKAWLRSKWKFRGARRALGAGVCMSKWSTWEARQKSWGTRASTGRAWALELELVAEVITNVARRLVAGARSARM